MIIKTHIEIYENHVKITLWLIEKKNYVGKLKKNNFIETKEDKTNYKIEKTELVDYKQIIKNKNIKTIKVNDISEIIIEDLKLLQNEQKK